MVIRVVTVATESRYYFPYLRETCKDIGGADLVVLGMGEQWGGYIWKFQKMLEYLKSIPGDEIVCFVDGYDVICVRNLKEMETKFLRIRKRKKCKMVIAKDHNVFPLDVILHVYFGKCGETRVNSGTYVGYASDILEILTAATRIFPEEKDDQRLITRYYALYPKKFYIDMFCDFFQVSLTPMKEFCIEPGRKPFFIHAAGCGWMTNVITKMGYKVDPNVKKNLKSYFVKKELDHIKAFLTRFIVGILIIVIYLFYSYGKSVIGIKMPW